MFEDTFDSPDQLHLPQRRNVRLDTLLRLRWLAIIGQTVAVLVVHYGFDFQLPIWACLAVIALSAWLNVALRVRFRMTQRLEPDRAAWLLAFDIAELAVLLLFLTGGLQNPFRVPVPLPRAAVSDRAAAAADLVARRLRRALRHRAGVLLLPAAVGRRRSTGTAVDLPGRRLALDSLGDRIHRRLRLAAHRGRPPVGRGARRDRAGAGPRAAPLAARRPRGRRRGR